MSVCPFLGHFLGPFKWTNASRRAAYGSEQKVVPRLRDPYLRFCEIVVHNAFSLAKQEMVQRER